MIISIESHCSLQYFPYIDRVVNFEETLHRKFLLKCIGIDRLSDVFITNEIDNADIYIKCRKNNQRNIKVLFCANKEDLIRYTEIYDSTLKIYPVYCMDFEPIDFHIPEMYFQWVVFSSKRAFEFFIRKIDIRFLLNKKIAAIGNKTAEFLRKFGLVVDFVPKSFSAKDLMQSVNTKVLVITALQHSNVYDNFSDVYILTVYKHILPKEAIYFRYHEYFDYALFSSPIAFNNTMSIYGDDLLNKMKNVIAIGPTTFKTLKNYGISCSIPQEYTIDNMFKLIK